MCCPARFHGRSVDPVTEVARRPSGASAPAAFAAELQTFEAVLSAELEQAGLPSDDVLVEIRERTVLLKNLDGALGRLDEAQRERSYYISKMIAAAAVGLFDAAPNYLWNETIGELRRCVEGYDLAYFFDVAVQSPERRKHLSSAEDLTKVDDQELLRAAREIGLLSDVGHRELDQIRYMRNYASAAHPNQVELTGLQLAMWLETCIRQVITLPVDTVTAQTGRLLGNLRTQQLSASTVTATTASFEDLPEDRADALAAGLFGLYTDPKRTALVADNVRLVWPELWPFVGDDARYGFGTRIGRFQAIADLGCGRGGPGTHRRGRRRRGLPARAGQGGGDGPRARRADVRPPRVEQLLQRAGAGATGRQPRGRERRRPRGGRSQVRPDVGRGLPWQRQRDRVLGGRCLPDAASTAQRTAGPPGPAGVHGTDHLEPAEHQARTGAVAGSAGHHRAQADPVVRQGPASGSPRLHRSSRSAQAGQPDQRARGAQESSSPTPPVATDAGLKRGRRRRLLVPPGDRRAIAALLETARLAAGGPAIRGCVDATGRHSEDARAVTGRIERPAGPG
jgi:hypothetical protein